MTLADAKLGMSKEVIATKVLPYLFPLSIENGLSVAQYAAIMGLIRDLVDRVELEHKAKLEQLSDLQNEQRYINFSYVNNLGFVKKFPDLLNSRAVIANFF